nr:hypothetical protein 11 [bacterium]
MPDKKRKILILKESKKPGPELWGVQKAPGLAWVRRGDKQALPTSTYLLIVVLFLVFYVLLDSAERII